MVSGIWRRIRSLVGGRPTSPEAGIARPYLPNLRYIPGAPSPGGTDVGRSAPPPPPPEAAPEAATPPDARLRRVAREPTRTVSEAPPPPVARLADSLSARLDEDETLRGDLTRDELRPLLEWARARIGDLAQACASLPPAVAAARFQQAGGQLLDLLRTANLAIGARASASPDLVVSRFQLLDTLIEPPLFEADAAGRARARLEALLAEPPERLHAADGAKLARRLVEALS